MKLWEVKANALRLMFSDTDFDFNVDEFKSGAVYDNPNTREKLVRMNDSIRRGIDLYYQYNSTSSVTKEIKLIEESGIYLNSIDPTVIDDMDLPLRIDAYFYNHDKSELMDINANVNFIWNDITGHIDFGNEDYKQFKNQVVFKLWYKVKRKNLPEEVKDQDVEYDLNETLIPEEVQRKLPYYIKGELYEEDEPSMANVAKQEYLQFIMTIRKKYSNVQKRVKTSPVFDSRNW